MDEMKSSPSGHPTTREQRGIQIARESCSCKDHTRTRKPCKHLFAVLAVRAKRSSCHCFGGWHYITVEEDGVERDEAVPCRRCNRYR